MAASINMKRINGVSGSDSELQDFQLAMITRARARRLEAFTLKKSGLTYAEVAKHLGVSRQRATRLVKRHEALVRKAR